MKKEHIKNAAEINNVKEITLACKADINVWRDYLEIFGLVPMEFNGAAKIHISVTEMKFMKIRFREFVISVFVTGIHRNSGSEASFLLLAFNSNKFFAWSERNFFSTPYYHGWITFDNQNYSDAGVNAKSGNIISISKSKINSRLPRFEGDDKWEGVVYLPNNLRKEKNINWFYAAISGGTKKYDYSGKEDSLVLNNTGFDQVFHYLKKSNIAGSEWIIRNNAFHSKSKTYTSL